MGAETGGPPGDGLVFGHDVNGELVGRGDHSGRHRFGETLPIGRGEDIGQAGLCITERPDRDDHHGGRVHAAESRVM